MNYNQGSLNLTEFWYYFLFKDPHIYQGRLNSTNKVLAKRKLTRTILANIDFETFKEFEFSVKPIEKPVSTSIKKKTDKKTKPLGDLFERRFY